MCPEKGDSVELDLCLEGAAGMRQELNPTGATADGKMKMKMKVTDSWNC